MVKFEIQAQALLDSLDRLHNISQTKNAKPILANTLIEARDGLLMMSTNDLEICLIVNKEALVESPGSITLPTQELFRLAGKMKREAPMQFVEEENLWVSIRSGRSKHRLSGLDPAEFPETPQIGEGRTLPLGNEDFSRIVDACLFSVSTDINKKTLNGVLCQGRSGDAGSCLRMVATDGHRLALADLTGVETHDLPPEGVILPGKGLREIRRILGGKEGELELLLGETHAGIRAGENAMYLRLYEGRFPDYDRVIPRDSEKRVIVDRAELTEAIARVSVFASEKYVGVKFELESGQLRLSFNNPGVGEASEELEVDYQGDPLTVSFNARYLIDVMNVLGEDKVCLQLNEVTTPCLIEEQQGNLRVIYVIMPMMP